MELTISKRRAIENIVQKAKGARGTSTRTTLCRTNEALNDRCEGRAKAGDLELDKQEEKENGRKGHWAGRKPAMVLLMTSSAPSRQHAKVPAQSATGRH